MSECEFNQEDFCTLQIEYPDVKKCSHAKGKLQKCTAKNEDLTEICSECGELEENCDCGTIWVLTHGKNGKIVPLTPKVYNELLKKGETK